METRSNFYYLLFTCDCLATTSYKLVCIFDALWAITTISFAINNITLGLWIGWVQLVFAVCFVYIGFRSVKLLMQFNSNLSSGTLHPETSNFLKVRVYTIALTFGEAIFNLIWVLYLYIGKKAGSANGTDIMWGQLFMAFLLTVFWFLLLGWGQLCLQKTMTEANDVLGGTKTDMAQNQVL